jgi:hypothetical protein
MDLIDFISDKDKKAISELEVGYLMRSVFNIDAATDGTITLGMSYDLLNGKRIVIDIDNSKTDKTSDDGGRTVLNKEQTEELIKALIAMRKAFD